MFVEQQYVDSHGQRVAPLLFAYAVQKSYFRLRRSNALA